MKRRDFFSGASMTGMGALMPMECAISTFISSPSKRDTAMALLQGVMELTRESPPHVKEHRWGDFLTYLQREFAPNPDHEAEMRAMYEALRQDPSWRENLVSSEAEVPDAMFAIALAGLAIRKADDGGFAKMEEWKRFAHPVANIVLGARPTVH